MSLALALPSPSFVRDAPTPTESNNHKTVNIVATIVPVVVIVAIVIWGLLFAGGLVRYRGFRLSSSSESLSSSGYNEKSAAVQDEPRMWEVHLKPGRPADIFPLSIELCPKKGSSPPNRGHRASAKRVDAKSRWRDTLSTKYFGSTMVTRPAQTTVLVAMPTPPSRTPAPEYHIGTRDVFYTEEAEEMERNEEEADSSDKPIMLDIYLHGYFA